MKTVAYLKTTLDRQEAQEQKLAILQFAYTEGITVSRLIEMPAAAAIGKRIEQLFTQVASGDTLIVSELSRNRSLRWPDRKDSGGADQGKGLLHSC